MTRFAIILALSAALGAMGQDKPNFSGTWKLDMQLTRFNGVEPPKGLTMRIDHKEPQIQITSETETKTGVVTEAVDLATDGTARELAIGGHPAIVAAHWDRWTGERLVWSVKRDTPEGPIEISRQAKLGEKGKILTTVTTIKSGAGEQKYYEFFVRE